MAYRRSFVRILGLSIRSSGVIGALLGETPVAGSSTSNSACTKGGSVAVIISMVIDIVVFVKSVELF